MDVQGRRLGPSFTTRAYAKINLGLRILGRREDGYHDLMTVMQNVDLFDTLSFIPTTSGVEVRCSELPLLEGPENLVHRAAEMLAEGFGVKRGVRVVIRKSIPVGAGLGGGSSDAALALRVLNFIWGIGASYEEMFELALQLGSDVPFFLRPGTAIASGRGEVLSYVDAPADVSYIILYPGFPVDTAWAYSEWDRRKMRLTCTDNYIKLLACSKASGRLEEGIYAEIGNDFEPLVFRRYPVLGSLKEELLSNGAIAASLSGSGSAIYGVFEGRETAGKVLKGLRLAGIEAFVCCPLVQWQDSGLWSR